MLMSVWRLRGFAAVLDEARLNVSPPDFSVLSLRHGEIFKALCTKTGSVKNGSASEVFDYPARGREEAWSKIYPSKD